MVAKPPRFASRAEAICSHGDRATGITDTRDTGFAISETLHRFYAFGIGKHLARGKAMDPGQGLIVSYLLDGQGGGEPLDWAGVRSWRPSRGPVWIHLDYTSEEAQHWLREESGVDSLIAQALLAEETRPRCAAMEDGLVISLRGVNNNPGTDPEDMVSIRMYCTKDRVISTRRRRLLTVRDLREALETRRGPRTIGELVATIGDGLVERMSGVIAELDDRIDELEERIIEGSGREVREGILDLRREIIQLRRYLAPQREAMGRLHTERVSWLNDHERLQVREAADKLTRHVEDLDSAKDRASVAYEELSSNMTEQMNSRMYVLSLVAGLFLPLGFLTGLLGINVGGIPLADSPWGFLEVVLLLVVLVILQVIVFRRKRWF
jgi:zinc transporter